MVKYNLDMFVSFTYILSEIWREIESWRYVEVASAEMLHR